MAMTLDKLDQIIYMKGEIAVIHERMKKASEHKYVSDSAMDYRSGYGVPISISGYAIPDYAKVAKIRKLHETRVNELEAIVLEAEEYIATIADSKIRTLLTLRFLEGMEWEQVARKIYKKMTGDAARKAVKKFFESM